VDRSFRNRCLTGRSAGVRATLNSRHALTTRADVFKHLTLSRLFALIAGKGAALAKPDSHAGIIF